MAWNLNPGDELHGLRIERTLGRGAFGQVYLATDLAIDRPVALKVVRAPAGSRELKRAQREARIVGRLQSPHVVAIHRVVEDPAREAWLLVLEYVPGGSLADLLEREERVSVPRALELLRGIMEGLDAAQQAGIVHGDVKPGNVLLEANGKVKLADFGLSWMVDDASISNTTDDALGGTPAYMAPEVIMGERGRVQSDLWSAGVIFYRLLAGRLPFPTESLHELFFSVQNASPPAFAESMPGSVQALAMNLLEKQPSQRPPSPADVIRRLDEFAGKPMPAHVEALSDHDEPVAPKPAPKLFGRDVELARLQTKLDALAEGRGNIVLIGGEAGIGKTALVRNLAERARDAGCALLELSATPLEGILRPLVRGTLDTLKRAEGRMLDAVLTRLAREARDTLLGHATASQAGRAAETMQQLAWGTEQFLREFGAQKPLVLILENLHVVEPEELRVVRELVARLQDARVLTLVTYRTHDVQASQSQSLSVAGYHDLTSVSGVDVLELRPLAPDAVLAMLNARLPGTFVSPELAHRVVEIAEGNPLFAGEMLLHLEEIGAIQREGSSLRAKEATGPLELPGRFHDLVLRRLAGLAEEPRTLLDAAAVDGRVFDGEAVAAMLERPLLGVLRDLQRLVREHHVIEPVGERYRFTSKLIQSVIYDQIAPALRRAMHAGLAEFLEARKETAEPERLGLHWERAGNLDRAKPHLLKAAVGAADQHLHRKALALAERAGWGADTVGEADAKTQPATLLALGKTLAALNRQAESARVFRMLMDHAPHESMRLRGALQWNDLLALTQGMDAVDEPVIRRASEFDDDPHLQALSFKLLGFIARQRDRLGEAQGYLERAAEIFRRSGDQRELAQTLMQLAVVAARAGRPERAEVIYAEAARINEFAGREANARVCDVNRALSRIQRGLLDGTRQELERAFRAFQLGGYAAQAVHSGCHLSQLLFSLGDLPGALAALAEAREVGRGVENRPALLEMLQSQFVLVLAKGRVSAARKALDEAQLLLDQDDIRAVAVGLACGQARWRVLVGDPDASAAAVHALQLAEGAEARIRAFPVWELIELVPLGLDPAVFPATYRQPVLDVLRPAMCAFGDPEGPAERLDAAVALFDDDPPAWCRASLASWRDAVAIEAAQRRGEDPSGAVRAALAAANEFGHVWWRAYFLRLMARLAPESGCATELDALVFEIADGVDDPSQKRRVVQLWSPPAGD